MAALSVRVTNFRTLAHLDFSPRGVCLLSGPNGAGKTTTLDVYRFLRALFEFGHESAFSAVSGSYFRRLGTPAEEPVAFDVNIGDLEWRLRFAMSDSGLRGTYGEELLRQGKTVLRARMYEEEWLLGEQRLPLDEKRCCAVAVHGIHPRRGSYG